MEQIAIVGVGLIGGSFALALRKAGFQGEITGVSSPRSIEEATRRNIIDRGVTLTEAANTADVLYLSQPIQNILQTIEQLSPLVGPDCLITDAGSTKAEIVAHADRFLPGKFLGGHPLAGKEQRGSEHADADLFRSRPYILTPTTECPGAAEFRVWLTQIGANVMTMSPSEHDDTVALTSHLPQILSTTLAACLGNTANPNVGRAFGPGLLDMTRLAVSTPEIWASIVGTNTQAIAKALNLFRHALDEAEANMLAGRIEPLFRLGADFASTIRNS